MRKTDYVDYSCCFNWWGILLWLLMNEYDLWGTRNVLFDENSKKQPRIKRALKKSLKDSFVKWAG
ncbi:MAG: hypothetical protein K6T88_18125 [Bacillus sp. (in: Bacteria)]|nr:hypothetical protein [Bacillus sp. (in: firmicutes)]